MQQFKKTLNLSNMERRRLVSHATGKNHKILTIDRRVFPRQEELHVKKEVTLKLGKEQISKFQIKNNKRCFHWH